MGEIEERESKKKKKSSGFSLENENTSSPVSIILAKVAGMLE